MKKTLANVDDFNIYMFPEGERNKEKCVKEFQSGAEKISKANNLDIVPVFIDDTLETVFKNAPFEETKTVRVYIGEIIKDGSLESNYKELLKIADKSECI